MNFKITKFLAELIGITLVILILILVILFAFFNGQKANEIIAAYFASLFIFISGFIAVNWGLKKSLKVLLIIVFGGMFLRFVLIGVTLFLVMRSTNLDIIAFIVSFFIFYLIYQFYEIRFINLKLSKGKKWSKFLREAS